MRPSRTMAGWAGCACSPQKGGSTTADGGAGHALVQLVQQLAVGRAVAREQRMHPIDRRIRHCASLCRTMRGGCSLASGVDHPVHLAQQGCQRNGPNQQPGQKPGPVRHDATPHRP
jgi:hypothetical protein